MLGQDGPGRRRAASVLACLVLWGTAPAPPAIAQPRPADPGLSWTVQPGPQVRTRDGLLQDFPVRDLPAGVDTITATLDGGPAVVDVRGLRADGTWSEWLEATGKPARLPETTRRVQVRLLTGPQGPSVRAVHLTAAEQGHSPKPRYDAAEFFLFATREGLVGGTTANGHIIRDRDHFVALPSRRGLAARGDGYYTVRVCTPDHGRCEWAPVWDVGPWNTTDDYWNPDRQSWTDLPRGRPQAQAAYEDGYNGGHDQFGRRVANPAGIDIADGMFWDGLWMQGSGWVLVRYEWTGWGPWGTVDADVLNVRAWPDAGAPQNGLAANRAQVRLECQVRGQHINGPQDSSDVWFRIADGRFISRAYVQVGEWPPVC